MTTALRQSKEGFVRTFGSSIHFPSVFINLLLLLLSSFLFSFSFPGFIFKDGLFPLAFFAFLPFYLVTYRIGIRDSILYGLFFGSITYMLFNYWLFSFNPLTFILVPILFSLYFAIFMPFSVLAVKCMGKWAFGAHLVFFSVLEILRTKGFLGYSYGVLGYSQFQNLSLAGITDIAGMSVLTLLVLFPSVFIASILSYFRKWSLKKVLLISGLYIFILLAAYFYGVKSKIEYKDVPTVRTALIQHNINSWLSGIDIYAKALDQLILLSQQALDSSPDLVVWSETAFVPSIVWHDRYRLERNKYDLVKKLLDFSIKNQTPFLIGNNDSYLKYGERIDFNAALLIEKGIIIDRYYKNHLVPFTEKMIKPFNSGSLARLLEEKGITFYQQGQSYNLLKIKGHSFGTTICYEDTFDSISRKMAGNGAEFFINLTNDGWSKVDSCARQHAAMAVFRSIENRRSSVRSTTTGLTCLIDPNGKIISSLDPRTADLLIADVPVFTGRKTLFTKWGNWLDLPLILTAGILIFVFFRKRSTK